MCLLQAAGEAEGRGRCGEMQEVWVLLPCSLQGISPIQLWSGKDTKEAVVQKSKFVVVMKERKREKESLSQPVLFLCLFVVCLCSLFCITFFFFFFWMKQQRQLLCC